MKKQNLVDGNSDKKIERSVLTSNGDMPPEPGATRSNSQGPVIRCLQIRGGNNESTS
jgi:hypothetical protein